MKFNQVALQDRHKEKLTGDWYKNLITNHPGGGGSRHDPRNGSPRRRRHPRVQGVRMRGSAISVPPETLILGCPSVSLRPVVMRPYIRRDAGMHAALFQKNIPKN